MVISLEFNFIRKITLTEVAVIYKSKVFIFHFQANNLTNTFDFDDNGYDLEHIV